MSRHRWLLAARPVTLWAGVAPVIVGTATAVDDDVFSWDVFVGALVVAISIQVGVNFANDLSDAARGADDADRIGPTRAVASGLISPAKMRRGIAAAFAVAAVAGLYRAREVQRSYLALVRGRPRLHGRPETVRLSRPR